MISLDALNLTSDLLWTDEYNWSPVSQNIEILLTGTLFIEEDVQQTGRPITLVGGDTFGYVKKSVVDALKVMADTPDTVYTLTLNNGTTYPVKFVGERFSAKMIAEHNNPDTNYYYTISLFLMVFEE